MKKAIEKLSEKGLLKALANIVTSLPSQKFIKNFVSFLRTTILRTTSEWLLLEINFPPTMMSCRAS